MTAEENEVLDRALEGFMDLVGGRLLLKPAVKAMDWLVRRFRYIIAQTSSSRSAPRTLTEDRSQGP